MKEVIAIPKVNEGKEKQKKLNPSIHRVLLGSIVPILLILVWEYLSRIGVFPPHLLPAPSIILQSLITMTTEGSLWTHTSITLYRLVLGFVFGTVAAVIIGEVLKWLYKFLGYNVIGDVYLGDWGL